MGLPEVEISVGSCVANKNSAFLITEFTFSFIVCG